MAYGPSVEYQVFQSFSAKLIDAVTDTAGPELFANLLIEAGFLSRRAADNKISANGHSSYTKVCNLVTAIDPAIKLARTPEQRREKFDKFLSLLCHHQLGIQLEELAQQMADQCRTKDPSYVSPFCSTHSVPETQDPVDKLNERPTLAQLMKMRGNGLEAEVIKTVAPNWKRFGAHLDFDETGNQLNLIAASDTLKSPMDRCQAMFQFWLCGNGVPATWRNLTEILRDFDESHLAETIESILGAT